MSRITVTRPITHLTIGPDADDQPRTVSITKSSSSRIVVKREGTSGPQGPQGPKGDQGPPGSSAVDDPGDLTLFFNNALI